MSSAIWISAFQMLCNKLVIDEFRTKVTIAKQEMKQRTSNDVITTLDLTNYWSNPTLLRFLLKQSKHKVMGNFGSSVHGHSIS